MLIRQRVIMVGSYIRKLRKSRGLTQKELGEMVGVGDGTISRWENGQRKPVPENIAKIADALGVRPSDLTSRMEDFPESASNTKPDYVTTPAEAYEWVALVARSDQSLDMRAALTAVAVFYDRSHEVVSFNRDAVAELIGEERLGAVWDDLLESEWLQRRGRARWTFRLKFPEGVERK